MSRSVPEQIAFVSGEVTPLLAARKDYQRHQTGVRTCRGFLPLPQGGATRAPGTIFLGSTRANARARLIPFEFADDDALTIELTPGFMRVWRYGALVESGGSPYELATPWATSADIDALQWVQSADVIYFADGTNPIRKLSRFALDNWTIGVVAFDAGPFDPMNLDLAQTVTCSAATGTIQVTTVPTGMFDASDAGSLVKVEPRDYEAIPIWSPNTTMTTGDYFQYDDQIYQVAGGSNTGVNAPVHREGTVMTDKGQNAKFTFISGKVGILRLTSEASAGVWNAEVIKTIPRPCVTGTTYRWYRGAWSDRNGYPKTLEIYDQRMFAANTPGAPRRYWWSVIGNPVDFSDGTDFDLGGAYDIGGSDSLNPILWLFDGGDAIYIGGLGRVFRAFPIDIQAAIGPTNMRVEGDSAMGASATRPILPGAWPVAIAKGGRRLTELRLASGGKPEPVPLSLPSAHLGETGFADIAWQADPYGYAWMRRGGGDLAAMIYVPSQEVLGWATVPVADGAVESLAVTPDPERGFDIVTLVVARHIDGADVRLVEEMAINQDALEGSAPLHEAVHLFAASVFAPVPASASFNLPHLANETLFAWTDQGGFGPLTADAAGNVTLPVAVGHAVIGLYDASHEMETLDIEPDTPDGGGMGRRKRLHAGGGIILHRTADGAVQVVEREFGEVARVQDPDPLVPREILTTSAAGYSGKAPMNAPSGHALETSLRFTPVGGAPLTILGLSPPVEEAGA